MSTPFVRSLQETPDAFPEPSNAAHATEWDADTDIQQSLSAAVHARRAEFTRPRTVRIKVGTWNVAAFKETARDVGGWFIEGKGIAEELAGLSVGRKDRQGTGKSSESREGFTEQEERQPTEGSTMPKHDPAVLPGGDEIGIYALGLQEVVDVNSAAEALRPYADPAAANRFKKAMEDALPSGYTLVAEQQLIGLLLLIYASPDVAPVIKSVSTTSVGTGLMGYMGNKGAVTARLVLGETTRVVFVNTHMSAGLGKAELERRNWDAAQIISRTRFDPITDIMEVVQEYGERIGDEDLAFWFGDLNYRLEGVPGDDLRRILMLHTQNEYDVGSQPEQLIAGEIAEATTSTKDRHNAHQFEKASNASSFSAYDTKQDSPDLRDLVSPDVNAALGDELDPMSDPASLQTTISSLLTHDELYQQQKAHKAFADGWREGPIYFLPTYKYDVGSVGVFDSSEKRRAPSWCDRILYRTRNDKLAYDKTRRDQDEAKKKDLEMKAQGLDSAADDEDTLFDYDPDADGDDDNEEAGEEELATPLEVTTKEGFEDVITLEYYTSHQRVLSSDHKPLNAVFKLKFDAVVPELRAKVHEEIAREFDKAENEGRPTITVVVEGEADGYEPEPIGIDFGKIRFGEPKVRNITVANTGLVPTAFGFVDGLEDETTHTTPQWIEIEVDHDPDKEFSRQPQPGDVGKTFSMEPGETCSVALTALIKDLHLVRRLNEGQSLDDVLVLRVRHGRDHFIPVRGFWHETSYGSTIDKLIRIPEGGVRMLQHQRPKAQSKPVSKSSKGDTKDENLVKRSAPCELLRLTESVEALVERTVAEWGMLRNELPDQGHPPWRNAAGWPFDRNSWTLPEDGRSCLRIDVFEALDTDQPFDATLPVNLHSLQKLEVLAESLLMFLHGLEDGVVTEDMWRQVEETYFAKDNAAAKQTNDDRRNLVLESLSSSPNHSVSFVILTAMLGRIAKEMSATVEELPAIPRPAWTPTASPRAIFRNRASSQDPAEARRQLIRKTYATIFANAMIRLPDAYKGKKVTEEQRCEIVEVFLEGNVTQ